MSKLNFKRINKRAAHYGRARAVYIGQSVTTNLVGTLYLNYNEVVKNDDLYNKLTPQQREECESFIKEYNQERRLIVDFTNETFNAQSFYCDDVTITILDELHKLGRAKPVTTLIGESIKKELLRLTEKDSIARDICDRYNYNYTQLQTSQKHKNVYTVSFEQRRSIIDLFLSLEEDKQNILNNLNDYLALNFNTNKQLSLEQLYRMIDPYSDYFPKSYMLGAMIDIIDRYGVNPTAELDIGVVFFYWYQIRLFKYSEPKSLEKFIKDFKLIENESIAVFEHEIDRPLIELMTREMTDKYVGLNN